MSDILLRAEALTKSFPVAGSRAVRVRALTDVDLAVVRGETLGIVGESGCGKSTLARCLVRLYPIDSGRVAFDGIDIATLSGAALRTFNRRVQMVFQDPYGSLNPRLTVRETLSEPFHVHRLCARSGIPARVDALLDLVHLPRAAAERRPHEFSGGQRQRIGIARALAVSPKLIVCDEAVSALDVSIQAQVINLLEDLQEQLNLTYIFIAHDLSVVEHISDRVAVMYLGRIVEIASARKLYTEPLHPYTEALLAAVPVPDPRVKRKRIPLVGDVPSPIHPPTGCHFHTRCPIAQFPRCSTEVPELKESSEGHRVACHFRG